MAKYKVSAEIYVEGTEIKTKSDAIDALVIMLGCYDDMDDTDTSITISPATIKRMSHEKDN